MDTSSGGTTVKAERAVHGRKRLVEEGRCRDKVLARRDKRIYRERGREAERGGAESQDGGERGGREGATIAAW